jgi:hypothetical protein
MENPNPAPSDRPDAPVDDDDTEAHAFKWDLVSDGKGGKRLRQGWNPDDPPPGRPAPIRPSSEGKPGSRR